MEATIHSAYVEGVTATPIKVMVRKGAGLPGPHLLGEPDDSARARELRVRVRAALIAAGFETAAGLPWTVEIEPRLPPARVSIAALDLPVVWGIMVATVPKPGGWPFTRPARWAFGHLGLDGTVYPCRGTAAALETIPAGALAVVSSKTTDVDYRAASRQTFPLPTYLEAWASLRDAHEVGADDPPPELHTLLRPNRGKPEGAPIEEMPENLRAWHAAILRKVNTGTRAVVLVGTPGAGKTMLARRLWTSILERAEYDPDVARIFSCAGLPASGWPSFRAPHHTASVAAMVGGGTPVRPGEVTLAHRGVLLLDEILEFPRASVAELATTLRRGETRIVRRSTPIAMPAAPALVVAATNPCPCGRLGSSYAPRTLTCTCSASRVSYWTDKIEAVARDLGAEICDLRKDP